jgi:hypothetical protein
MSDSVDVTFTWYPDEAPSRVVGDLLEILEASGLVTAGKVDETRASFRLRVTDAKARKQFIGYGMRGVECKEAP